MALTTAQQVRLGIQDQPLWEDRVMSGDGLTFRWNLSPHTNVSSGTAYVSVPNGWLVTGSTWYSNPASVYLDRRVSANSAFRLTYIHSVFSDDEIDYFVSANGNTILGAQIAAVETLMFDSLKRASWTSPDGMSVNDTQAQSMLQQMHDRLVSQRADSIIDGAVGHWDV